MPNPSSTELHDALATMARVEAGESESLDGLPGWLTFLLHLPDESDRTAADVELAQTIRGALDHVREHPERPKDPLVELERILEQERARDRRAAVTRWCSTQSTSDLADALERIAADPSTRRRCA